MNRLIIGVALLATVCCAGAAQAFSPEPITWDGGNGNWVGANWNGGQTALATIGREDGIVVGDAGAVGWEVTINDGNVTTTGDDGFEVMNGTLNLTGGAVFTQHSAADQDGMWATFDGKVLNIDNGTLVRDFDGVLSETSGPFIFGSWDSYKDQVIGINLTNGGSFVNDGQLWFGASADSATGLTVNMTINDGSLDLTGGDAFEIDNGGGMPIIEDLAFIYGYDADTESMKDEQYSINFTGAGSITTDNGIVIGEEDEFGFHLATLVSYQDLWDRGILQYNGFSKAKEVGNFGKFFTVTGTQGSTDYTVTSTNFQAAPITWDGGNGAWNSANWNGGSDAATVMGRTNGIEVGTTGAVGYDVYITSGDVTYDATNGDFRYKSGGSLNLSGGATLTINSITDVDGVWTEWDGSAINIDNASLIRTFGGDSLGGGAFMLGSWRSYEGQVIEVNLTNGGSIVNDGQLWFGASQSNAPGLTVKMTINDGTLDLTGGSNFELDNDNFPILEDLAFIYGYDTDTESMKNEQYSINFTGPGSIITDNGIIIGEEDEFGFHLATLVSYQDLWNRGILQAQSFSGATNTNFDKFFTVTGTQGSADYTVTSNNFQATAITWDGGNGNWLDANWNGGQTALATMGREDGIVVGEAGAVGWEVTINGGNVTTTGDSGFEVRNGTLNVTGGAVFTQHSAADQDGMWATFDGKALNLDNGTLVRDFDGVLSETSGPFIFGSWDSYKDQVIEINLTNGGSFVNDGQLWFGTSADSASGLTVKMTINDGTLDLTGGDAFEIDNGGGMPIIEDLAFIFGYDADTESLKNEQYSINFTGAGSITTDNGIVIGEEDEFGFHLATLVSYQDLWNRGILQALGFSGATKTNFDKFFTVTGTQGDVDYTLTSLLTGAAVMDGDFDLDGDVDGNDFLYWQINDGSAASLQLWKDNLGNTGAAAVLSAVPEPASALLLLMGAVAFGFAGARRRES